MTTDSVHEIAQGRVWSGSRAIELGLVDHLGDLEQAIEGAARLAAIEEYSVWYVEPEKTTQEKVLQTLAAKMLIVEPATIDPVSILMRQLQGDLDFLGHLDDPRGAYVICGHCPINP